MSPLRLNWMRRYELLMFFLCSLLLGVDFFFFFFFLGFLLGMDFALLLSKDPLNLFGKSKGL